MGVGVGLFRMTQAPPNTVDSLIPPEKESGLAEAYAQSAAQDKLMTAYFDVALDDGLLNADGLAE